MSDDEDNPENIARFERIARQMEQLDQLRSAIGGFLADFALFESMSLTMAITALSLDQTLVGYLPELMDLSKRLKLLRLLGRDRQLPQELQGDIKHVCGVATALLECRNEIAHGMAILTGPFLTEPDAELTPGVVRPRSQIVASLGTTALTVEQLRELEQQWVHSRPTILKWSEIAVRLQRSTQQLAEKLGRHQRAEAWQGVVVTRVEKPVRVPTGGSQDSGSAG